MCFNVQPLPLTLMLGTTSLVPSFLFIPVQYLYTWTGSTWASSSLGWTAKILLCRTAFQSASTLYWSLRLLKPRCRNLHFLCWTWWGFSHFSFLSRFLWKAVCPCGVLTTLSSFLLLWACSGCALVSSHVINESIRNYWPQYWSLGCTTSVLPPAGLHATLPVWPFLFSIHLTVHWYNPYIVSFSVRILNRGSVKGL